VSANVVSIAFAPSSPVSLPHLPTVTRLRTNIQFTPRDPTAKIPHVAQSVVAYCADAIDSTPKTRYSNILPTCGHIGSVSSAAVSRVAFPLISAHLSIVLVHLEEGRTPGVVVGTADGWLPSAPLKAELILPCVHIHRLVNLDDIETVVARATVPLAGGQKEPIS
jgi:hypothetical protein